MIAKAYIIITIFLGIIFLNTFNSSSQVVNDYRSRQSGDWSSAATWERFNGSLWDVASSVPDNNSGTITIQGGHNVTVSGNIYADQIVVSTSANLVINAEKTLFLLDGVGIDMASSGQVLVQGVLNSAGQISSNVSNLVVFNQGKYLHAQNGGSIPVATWESGSTCEIYGVTNLVPANLNQSFHHFVWNCAGQSANINLNAQLTTINGDFIINSTNNKQLQLTNNNNLTLTVAGNLSLIGSSILEMSLGGGASTINLSGNLNLLGGVIQESKNGATPIVFNGSGTQVFNRTSGSIANNSTIDIVVNSGSTLFLGNNIIPSTSKGAFTLNAGATLVVGHPQGIASKNKGAVGNVQSTGTRTYSSNANYVYNGSSDQVTGDGLPATVNQLRVETTNGAKLTMTANTLTTSSLEINNFSKLEVGSGKTIYITGTMNNMGGSSSLVVKSDASGSGSFISSGNVSATIERNVPVTTTPLYHYISSPVNGASISQILDATRGNYNAYRFDAPTQNWVRVFGPDPMEFGKAYSIPYAGNDAKLITYSGSLNTSSGSTSISYTPGHWNLLGNPYSAPISVNAFVTNNTNIVGAVYFFDDNGAPYLTSDYAVSNATGSIQTGASGKAGQTHIAIGQGFFVQSNGNGNKVDFIPAWRTSGQNPLFFVANPEDNNLVQKFYLDIEDNMGASNQILVGFLDDATKNFDRIYDAPKRKGNPNLALFSIIPADTNTFAIQGRPLLNGATDTVFIGLDAVKGGHYTFHLNRTENFDNLRSVILVDKVENTITDLFTHPEYTFSSGKGFVKDRFYLVFNAAPVSISRNDLSRNSVNVSGKKITIDLGNNTGLSEIELIDLRGKVLFRNTYNTSSLEFNTEVAPGFYILKIQSGSETITKRILIN